MTTLLVQHSVQDYDHWKAAFDGHADNRRSHGALGHRVVRDGAAVTALIDFPDRNAAEEFVNDPALREAMDRAGVQGPPSITFADDMESISY
jgi:hypothetical protein